MLAGAINTRCIALVNTPCIVFSRTPGLAESARFFFFHHIANTTCINTWGIDRGDTLRIDGVCHT
jgi:hypothetical protein